MTLIFDFDGTLAQTLILTRDIYNTVANDLRLPLITDEDMKTIRDKSAREVFKIAHLSPLMLPKVILRIQSQMKHRLHEAKVVPGMPQVLREMYRGGTKLGIVSSNSEENLIAFLKMNKLYPYFDFIHSEKNIFGKGKVLANVLRTYKLEREYTLYVGDEVRDIEAARDAKMKIVSVTWGFNSEEKLLASAPDYLVRKPKDLLRYH